MFGDVTDIADVAANVAVAIFWNMGENCSAGSRLIVHRSRKDGLLEALAGRARGVAGRRPARPGDEDRRADLARPPRAGARLRRRSGRDEGARLVTGGERILEETGGYFVPPTIFDGVRNDMRIAREEIFGPVLSVIEFDTEAEAVAIANDTPYGLAASIYTDDLNVAHRVARELRAGVDRRQRLRRGRHDDAVRRLQAVGLRRARQVGPRPRPVHRDEDDLDRAEAARLTAATRAPP